MTEANGTIYPLPCSFGRSGRWERAHQPVRVHERAQVRLKPWVSECVLCAQTLPLLDLVSEAVPVLTRARRRVVRAEKPKGQDGVMLPRVLAGAATAWSMVYLVVYLWVIDAQEGEIEWWSF
jgi:hypothetical protein